VSTAVILNETAIVTLDSNGNGQAKLGPISAREIWSPASAHVQANAGSVTNEATCYVYMGDQPVKQNFRDATFSGSSGDSTDRISADIIKCGWYVWAVWSGGDAGATAYLNVIGSKSV
jgi:hypothetical protein